MTDAMVRQDVGMGVSSLATYRGTCKEIPLLLTEPTFTARVACSHRDQRLTLPQLCAAPYIVYCIQ